MKDLDHIQPPAWANRFFRWFCSPDVAEEIEGDLHEAFYYRLERQGHSSAKLHFVLDVFRFFRPSYFRKPAFQPQNFSVMSFVLHYFKSSWRGLIRQRVYTIINILGLSIGICCFLLLGSMLKNELSYDTFHNKSERIFRVVVDPVGEGGSSARVGAPWGPAMAETYPEIEAMVRCRFVGSALFSLEDKKNYEGGGLYVDPSFLNIFSFPILKGEPSHMLQKPDEIVLTRELANKYFGKQNPIGQRISFGSAMNELTVAGVIENPPQNSHMKFTYLLPFERHAKANEEMVNRWEMFNYHLYVLLPNENADQPIEEKLPNLLSQHMDQEDLDSMQVSLQPIEEIHLHSHRRNEFEANSDMTYIWILGFIAIFILLIACVNYMNLSTAHSLRRAREVGLRKVVGASRYQLIFQFLTEALILSGFSLLLALILVKLFLPTFNQITGQDLMVDFTSGIWLIAMGIAIALITGFVSGSYPAIYLSRFRPVQILNNQKTNRLGRLGRMRQLLVVFQFAISIILIISVGIVYQQIDYFQYKSMGFNKEQIVVIPMRSDDVINKTDFYRQEFQAIPSVKSVATSSGNLGGGDWGVSMKPEGAAKDQEQGTRILIIDPEYIPTLDMKLKYGRNFSREYGTDTNDAFLINETAAKLLGWENPVGKRIQLAEWRKGQIVGVVNDFHFRSLHQEIEPLVMFQQADYSSIFSVKVEGKQMRQTLAELQGIWEKNIPHLPFSYSFLDETFAELYEAEARTFQVFLIFAGIAIFLACMGLFGLASYTAEQRRKEMSIRKVLGASVQSLFLLLSGTYIRLILLALLVSVPVSWFMMSKWLENFAYHIDIQSWVFIAAGIIALTISWLTISFQSLKAARANPVEALREE